MGIKHKPVPDGVQSLSCPEPEPIKGQYCVALANERAGYILEMTDNLGDVPMLVH